MEMKAIPSSGERLPVIGLGTWQAFDVGATPAAREPLRQVLAEFARLGGALVDSSPMYGAAESVVGALAAELHLRPSLFIATKVWTTGEAAGRRQIEASLRKLGADPIDLLQVHNLVDATTQLATLRALKREARVRYVGVTHYQASAHDALLRYVEARAVDFVQVNYSAAERDAERTLLPAAQANGVAVIANRPFGGGELVRRVVHRPLPAWAADAGCSSWPQLLLKFVVSHEAVTCAIPATSHAEHLVDNMRAGDGPMPDAELRRRIADAAASI